MFFSSTTYLFCLFFLLLFPHLSLQFLFNLVANPTSSWLNLITISFFCSYAVSYTVFLQFHYIISSFSSSLSVVSTHMSQILISYIMNTNLPVSVCVCYKKTTNLTHTLLYCVANLPTQQQCRKEWKILVGSRRTKTCNLAALLFVIVILLMKALKLKFQTNLPNVGQQ